MEILKNPDDFDVKNIENILISNDWGKEYEKENLLKTFSGSSYVAIAKIKDKEIGYIRALSDNHSVSFICELIVHKDFQNKGVGTRVLKEFLDDFKHTAIYAIGSKNNSSFLEKFSIKKITDFLAFSKSSLA